MPTPIGARVGAIRDSDNKNVNLFGYGVFVGYEEPPEYKTVFGPNPKIQLDSGDVVWGYQCWWGPEDKIREHIGDRHVTIVPVVVQNEETVDG